MLICSAEIHLVSGKRFTSYGAIIYMFAIVFAVKNVTEQFTISVVI